MSRARNPLTDFEKSQLKHWADVQFAIARRYRDIDRPRSEFYLGRSVAAGKIAGQYNPIEPYYCKKCKHKHRPGTRVYFQHYAYKIGQKARNAIISHEPVLKYKPVRKLTKKERELYASSFIPGFDDLSVGDVVRIYKETGVMI